MTRPSVWLTFIARMLAESVRDDPEQLAAEHVRNDLRLAQGDPRGETIAAALHEVESKT